MIGGLAAPPPLANRPGGPPEIHAVAERALPTLPVWSDRQSNIGLTGDSPPIKLLVKTKS